ncbi:hypothetical protein [Arsenicibacter rosenii]|uniref:hypothetical protein n=1 Tax=Arsenicibacter rosenii TaxID=1750698 RepID=UPI0015A5D961|nr:hypothetical protein [Arsenicibacter rosenii]
MIESVFKQLEPEDSCPAHLKTEIISEIDLIRNALQVVELFAGDFFGVLSVLANSQEDA